MLSNATPLDQGINFKNSTLAPICANSYVTSCDKRNQAFVDACHGLIDNLQRDENQIIGSGTKMVCQGSNPNRCCAEWTQGAEIRKGDLAFILERTAAQCIYAKDNRQVISGRVGWITLGGRCNTLCFSNGHSRCHD